jgi:hypothetical protein
VSGHPPILDRLLAEGHAEWQHLAAHLPHHPTQQPEGPPMTTPIPTRIRDAIEADLSKAGKTVDADVHAILSHHLGLGNFAQLAGHVAQLAATLQATPWLQVAEECLGMPPAVVSIAASYAPALARDLAHVAQPAAPAAPAAAQLPPPEPAPAA